MTFDGHDGGAIKPADIEAEFGMTNGDAKTFLSWVGAAACALRASSSLHDLLFDLSC
jgi:hypothetical protein